MNRLMWGLSRHEIEPHYFLTVLVHAYDFSPDVFTANVADGNHQVDNFPIDPESHPECLVNMKCSALQIFKLHSTEGNVYHPHGYAFGRIRVYKAGPGRVERFAVILPLFERDDKSVAATAFDEARMRDLLSGETHCP